MEAYLRSREHSSKLWLSIYKPKIVFAGRVNDSGIDVGEESITYDSVTSGSYSNIESGMTLYVGSSQYGSDIGRVRVKSATNTVLSVAENSEINWQDNQYLTVKSFYEIWSVFPFYVQEGENVTFYKDKDIVYTNQNSDEGMGSLVCMGTHYAGFVGDEVYYTATGTVSVSSQTPLTYAWTFEGGHTGSSNVHTPGYVRYDTPGHYTTKLVVQTSQGIQDIAYRHVSIYDRPGGTKPPTLKWELTKLSGSRDEGGYTAAIRVWENISDIVDGALVVLFSEDTYGEQDISIGGNSENRSSILMVGYILEGSIRYDYRTSSVEFEIGSCSEIMKQQPGLSISLDSVAAPTDWYELEDLDILKVIYHYFRWHSTVLKNTDVRYVGTNHKFQYFDNESASLYDAFSSFMQDSLLGYLIADRQNNLYAEIGIEAINNATGTVPVDIEILRQDWIGEPSIAEQFNKEIAYLELSGVAWSGVATGTWEEFIAAAPGSSMAYYGSVGEQTGLILTSQGDLNTLVGNVFAYKNARYPDVSMRIAGNYRNFDIVPYKQELLTIFPGDTQRGITFNKKAFFVTEVEWSYDPHRELLYPEISLREITQGFPGVTVTKPQTPVQNYPPLPPLADPIWPDIPFPTIDPVAPPVVPVPPIGDLNCPYDDNAAPNGPHQLWAGATIRSDDTNPEMVGWLGSVVRRNTATHKTRLVLFGKWEKSYDGGATWEAWNDTYFWGVSAGADVTQGVYPGTPIDTDSWVGGINEYRTFEFDAFAYPIGVGGYTVWLDKIYAPDALFSGTYWSYGPFEFTQLNPGTSEENHDYTVNVPEYGGEGVGEYWVVQSEKDLFNAGFEAGEWLAANGTNATPTVWGDSSPFQNVTGGVWYFHPRVNMPPGWSAAAVLGEMFDALPMGLVNVDAYNDWDGTAFEGYYIVRTKPPTVFVNRLWLYMVMYGGVPPIYKLTLYDMYVYNICYLSDFYA